MCECEWWRRLLWWWWRAYDDVWREYKARKVVELLAVVQAHDRPRGARRLEPRRTRALEGLRIHHRRSQYASGPERGTVPSAHRPPPRSCSVWLLAGYLARRVVLRSDVEHTHVVRARDRVVQREAVRPVDRVAEDLAPVVDRVVARRVPRRRNAVARAVRAERGGGVSTYRGQDVRPAGKALVRCGHAG